MTYCTHKWNELYEIYRTIEDKKVQTNVALAYNRQKCVGGVEDICSLLERTLKDHGVNISEKPTMDGADEYDDIIAAQDLIERG